MNKTFVISDESKNSYDLRIITSGIDTTRFLKNPVMFYMHDRTLGVIGRWENLRIEGVRLLADPVFDESDELAVKIKRKVESGFIKSASIGISIDEKNIQDGIVYSCSLKECSIVDIPSNENALALYDKDDRIIENPQQFILNLKLGDNNMNDLKSIIEVLGLQANASVDDIIAAIRTLKQSVNPEVDVEKAIKMNFVADYERQGLLALSYNNPTAFASYMETRQKEVAKQRMTQGTELITKAMRSGAINNDSEGKVKRFWLDAFVKDFDTTKDVLESIPTYEPIAPKIIEANKAMSGWTLNDYRKNAPQELKNNPQLYQTLLEQESKEVQTKH